MSKFQKGVVCPKDSAGPARRRFDHQAGGKTKTARRETLMAVLVLALFLVTSFRQFTTSRFFFLVFSQQSELLTV